MIDTLKQWFRRPLTHLLQDRTIREQLLTTHVLVVLLGIMAMTIGTIILGFSNEKAQAIEHLQLAATYKKTEVNLWLEDLYAELDAVLTEGEAFDFAQYILKQRNAAVHATEEEAERFAISQEVYLSLDRRLKQYNEQTQDLDALFILDLNGTVAASTEEEHRGDTYAHTTYFRQGLKEFYIHPILYNTSTKRYELLIASPIVDQAAQELGVLVGRANVNILNDIMTVRVGLGDSGETYLVGTDYTLLTESRFGETGLIYSEGLHTALEKHASGYKLYKDYRGVPVVGVFYWLPDLQAVLLAEQNQAETFQSLYSTLVFYLGIAILAVLVAAAASLFIARRIATPLAELSQTAMQIAQGDLALQAPEQQRQDEIGNLAQAFNTMKEQLRDMLGREQNKSLQLEREIEERQQIEAERGRLQQEVIEAQQRAIHELSTPIIPVMDHIIVMPLIGNIDTLRAKEITRALLQGISNHRAKYVILDLTGVPIVDTSIVNHLNKTIQAARLKGTRVLVTGLSDAVAETIVDLGIDWSNIQTLRDLQTGLRVALKGLGIKLNT